MQIFGEGITCTAKAQTQDMSELRNATLATRKANHDGQAVMPKDQKYTAGKDFVVEMSEDGSLKIYRSSGVIQIDAQGTSCVGASA